MAASSSLLDVRDVEIWANTKLSGDWSAPSVVSQIDASKLRLLNSVFGQGKLDQLVKVRLLIACQLLPHERKEELANELRELSESATADDDEWVRVIGCAVGDFRGQLDLDAVMQQVGMVHDTIDSLSKLLDNAKPPSGFMPLEEMYLHPDIRTLPRHHAAGDSPSPSPADGELDFHPREGVEGLPDFSLDALLGGGMQGGPREGKASARSEAPSVHARRGMGLSGTGMFIARSGPAKAASNLGKSAASDGVGGGGADGAGTSTRVPGAAAGGDTTMGAGAVAPGGLSDYGAAHPDSTPHNPPLGKVLRESGSLPPGFLRPSKMVALAVDEAASLNAAHSQLSRRGSGATPRAASEAAGTPTAAAAATAATPTGTPSAADAAVAASTRRAADMLPPVASGNDSGINAATASTDPIGGAPAGASPSAPASVAGTMPTASSQVASGAGNAADVVHAPSQGTGEPDPGSKRQRLVADARDDGETDANGSDGGKQQQRERG